MGQGIYGRYHSNVELNLKPCGVKSNYIHNFHMLSLVTLSLHIKKLKEESGTNPVVLDAVWREECEGDNDQAERQHDEDDGDGRGLQSHAPHLSRGLHHPHRDLHHFLTHPIHTYSMCTFTTPYKQNVSKVEESILVMGGGVGASADT
jgi:hypothetical protein